MPTQLLTAQGKGCAEAHSCSLRSRVPQAVNKGGVSAWIFLDCPHGTARYWQWSLATGRSKRKRKL
jgi:hypothetical protein